MLNQKYYWGESIDATVETKIEDEATTATLIIGTNPQIVKTASFSDGIADVSIDAEDTEVNPGTYEYQLIIHWADGEVKKYPDVLECSTCTLPKITILPSLDMPGAS